MARVVGVAHLVAHVADGSRTAAIDRASRPAGIMAAGYGRLWMIGGLEPPGGSCELGG